MCIGQAQILVGVSSRLSRPGLGIPSVPNRSRIRNRPGLPSSKCHFLGFEVQGSIYPQPISPRFILDFFLLWKSTRAIECNNIPQEFKYILPFCVGSLHMLVILIRIEKLHSTQQIKSLFMCQKKIICTYFSNIQWYIT